MTTNTLSTLSTYFITHYGRRYTCRALAADGGCVEIEVYLGDDLLGAADDLGALGYHAIEMFAVSESC